LLSEFDGRRPVRMVLTSLSQIFKKICAKVIDSTNLEVMGLEITKIMSTIEKIFPLACFDIMTHLVEQLNICGPIYTRGMYPMARYMKALKGYVRNMARTKGSMAMGYSIVEALGFFMEYIQEVKSTRKRVWDDKEEPTMHNEILEGNG
jgi:hypothetical protein